MPFFSGPACGTQHRTKGPARTNKIEAMNSPGVGSSSCQRAPIRAGASRLAMPEASAVARVGLIASLGDSGICSVRIDDARPIVKR